MRNQLKAMICATSKAGLAVMAFGLLLSALAAICIGIAYGLGVVVGAEGSFREIVEKGWPIFGAVFLTGFGIVIPPDADLVLPEIA